MSEGPVPSGVATAAAPLHPWLQPFLPQDQPMVRAWFAYAVSQGARTPQALVEMVQRVVSSKLEWSVSPTSITLCEATLASLAHRRGEALDYAATLLTALGAPRKETHGKGHRERPETKGDEC